MIKSTNYSLLIWVKTKYMHMKDEKIPFFLIHTLIQNIHIVPPMADSVNFNFSAQ